MRLGALAVQERWDVPPNHTDLRALDLPLGFVDVCYTLYAPLSYFLM
jgi:hypothetical protein